MKLTKSFLSIALTLAILSSLTFIPSSAKAALSSGVVATANSGRLNLRAAPSEKSVSLGMYYNGTAFDILEYTSESWLLARIGGKTGGMIGYFSRRFVLETVAPENSPNMKPTLVAPMYTEPQTIYGSPRKDSRVLLGTIQPSEYNKIEVLGDIDDAVFKDWHHVIYHAVSGDIAGFVQGGVLQTKTNEAKVYVVDAPAPVYSVNLRVTASTADKAIGAWYTGTVVTVLDETEDWAHVRIGDPGAATISGYIMKKYLSENVRGVIDRRPVRYLKQDGRAVMMFYEPSASSVSDVTYPQYTLNAFVVLGESNEWLQVVDQVTSAVGWIIKANFQ